MATFVDLDSSFRNRIEYASPANYNVKEEDIRQWSKFRTVSNTVKNPVNRPTSFLFSVNIKSLILPFNPVGGTVLTDEPRIYLDVSNEGNRQANLIDTIGQRHSNAKFICEISTIQTDFAGNPKWIRYHSLFEQVMLFDNRKPLIIRMYLSDGTEVVIPDAVYPAPILPDNQTFITLEITPYIRDGDYSNHMTDFI